MKRPPIRLWIGIMIFMTTFTCYMVRSNMSISIVSMVIHKGKNTTPPCLGGKLTKNSTKKPLEKFGERFEWNENTQGLILQAYFWGYMVTSLPAGTIAELVGPFHVIFWSSVVAALLTGLTPISVKLGYGGVLACRFGIGLSGGFIYPAINVLIAHWAPPKEKGKFLAAMMGNTLGTIYAWNLVPAVSSATESWAWGFYALVISMVVYCLVFSVVVTDSPTHHRWITDEERNYILECQEGSVTTTKAVPPYKQILLSCPFWALTVAHFGNLWGLNLILTYAPKFMAETLGFKLGKSGITSSLPYLARLVTSQIFGIVGDYMRKKEVMTVTRLRKFFIFFSHIAPAVCLFLIRAAGCNHYYVITFLVLSQGFNGAAVVSHLVNPQDIAPNFAGTLWGIMNGITQSTGFIVPAITGAVNAAKGITLEAALIIYMVGGTMFALGGILFILFGSGELQPWNVKEKDKKVEET